MLSELKRSRKGQNITVTKYVYHSKYELCYILSEMNKRTQKQRNLTADFSQQLI